MSHYDYHGDFDHTFPMFESALNRLRKKHPEKYAFILRGGYALKDSLFILMKSVWSSETIPEGWKKTDII